LQAAQKSLDAGTVRLARLGVAEFKVRRGKRSTLPRPIS
jgi:hypothetical protein